MRKLILTTGTEADFFAHGREIARLADQGLPLPEEKILRFEDPAELASLITEHRIHLLQEIKKHSSTITQLSTAVGRSRSSVKKDIDILERAGILSVTSVKTSGMRDRKVVQITANEISLVADII